MHGAGDQLPAFDLGVGPDARSIGIADAHGGDRGGFGDDQAGGGALGVIFGHQGIRHPAFVGAAAGQGRHDDAVGKLEIAHLDGLEQKGHKGLGNRCSCT